MIKNDSCLRAAVAFPAMTKNKLRILPYLLLLPALAFILIFKIYPLIYCFIRGFQYKGNWSLKTFYALFTDSTFWSSLWVTLKLNIIMTPLQLVLSFVVALLVNKKVRGVGVFRSLFYLPVTVSMPVAAVIWSMIFSFNNGLANSMLSTFFGVQAQGFFNDAGQALWCIIALSTWKGCGYWMMFHLAGLKNINTSLYEAARMDGASSLQILFKITLPLLKKTALFVMVADTSINILLFAPMQLITKGGPAGSTNVLMYEAYKQAFKYGNYEKGAATTCVLVVLILIIVFLQFKLMKTEEE